MSDLVIGMNLVKILAEMQSNNFKGMTIAIYLIAFLVIYYINLNCFNQVARYNNLPFEEESHIFVKSLKRICYVGY